MGRWLHESATDGVTAWADWSRQVERARRQGAQLMGAEPEEIALIRNTTEGINLVAEGLAWEPGDNVVTLDDEFPSNQYPWLNLAPRGVETRRVSTDRGRLQLERLADACDHRTRLVSVSWVGYATGFRHDLEAIATIAHDRDALLLVDAIQALGVFPLDVGSTSIDFLAADGHKWLLGPEGAGLMFIRRSSLNYLRPLGIGWNSVIHAHDFSHIELNLKTSAARYEGGSQNMAGFLGLGASVELLLGYGTANLSRAVTAITDLACARLIDIGATIVSHREGNHRSGIVTFELPGHDSQTVRQACLQRGIALSCRGGYLRISPHGYNNEEDVERLIEAMVE